MNLSLHIPNITKKLKNNKIFKIFRRNIPNSYDFQSPIHSQTEEYKSPINTLIDKGYNLLIDEFDSKILKIQIGILILMNTVKP